MGEADRRISTYREDVVTGFTPTLSFLSPGDENIVLSEAYGFYLVHGRLVTLTLRLTTSTFTHSTAAGKAVIGGLPYPVVDLGTASDDWYGACSFEGWSNANVAWIVAVVDGGSDPGTMHLRYSRDNNTRLPIGASDMPSGGTVKIRASVSYLADIE